MSLDAVIMKGVAMDSPCEDNGPARQAGLASAQTRPVRPLGDARDHYWLALGMSQVVGLDLQAEMEAGTLSSEQWSQSVTRCRSCDWSGECPAWMAMHRLDTLLQDSQGARPDAPTACANANVFNALRRGEAIEEDVVG